MNVAKIKKFDIANGPGIRTSLYVSGCTHHCKECFQPETWNFNYGFKYTEETKEEVLEAIKTKQGLSLLGGDPLDNICNDMLDLILEFNKRFPQKDIWLWTGYVFEDIINNEDMMSIIKNVDVIVDGPFIQDKKDLTLKFKGSHNQRVIDVQESLKQNKVIIIDKYNN